MSETQVEELEAGEAGDLEPDAEPEPEQGDDDLEPEEAGALAAPETEGWSEAEREKRYGKITQRFKTYQAAVERELEEEATDLLPCPLCFVTPHPAFVNRHGIGAVPEEVQVNVKMFLGYAREQQLRQDPGTNTCETCGGLTKVETGAKAGDYITRTCPNCKGYGFTPPPSSGNGSAQATAAAVQVTADAAADFQEPDRDSWGEPRTLPDGTVNGNYGKMPQFKTVHPKYGITAQLGAAELVTEQG